MRAGTFVIIIAAVLGSMAALMLSAHDVTTCNTEYDYIGEISGAFEGDQSDIITVYNPAANVTGWSTTSGYNGEWLSGVAFEPSQPNAFYFRGDGNGQPVSIPDTLTFYPDPDHPQTHYKLRSALRGDISGSIQLPVYKQLFVGDIDPDLNYRALDMISLTAILQNYERPNEIITLSATPDLQSGYWPGIMSDADLEWQPRRSLWHYIGTPITSISYDSRTGLSTVAGSTVSTNTMYIGVVRNVASWEPIGDVVTFTMSVALTRADILSYINPSAGVMPQAPDVYWNNNQLNSSMRIAITSIDFTRTIASEASTAITVRVENTAWLDTLNLSCDRGIWTIRHNYTTVDLGGSWPGIELIITDGTLAARPMIKFVDFDNYTLLGTTIDLPWGSAITADTTEIRFTNTSNIRLSVVETSVRIVGGGDYLHDATLDPAIKFPGDQIVKLTFGSFAHLGDSIVFSSIGNSVMLPVSEAGITIADQVYPLDGISFIWVSDNYNTVRIGGVDYPAAIYFNGKSYDSGAIWAQTASGDMIRLLDTNLWTVTLAGIWAAAVFYYDGDNVAASHTELQTPGSFPVGKNEILISYCAAAIGIGLIMSYVSARFSVLGNVISPMNIVDWIMILATVSVAVIFI